MVPVRHYRRGNYTSSYNSHRSNTFRYASSDMLRHKDSIFPDTELKLARKVLPRRIKISRQCENAGSEQEKDECTKYR